MIHPTIGRRVWFWPSDYDQGKTSVQPPTVMTSCGDQPMDAGIAFVHNERLVNVTVADHLGKPHVRTSVKLLQEGDEPVPGMSFCTWMPYQPGQAKAAEAPVETPPPVSNAAVEPGAVPFDAPAEGAPAEALPA